MEPPVAPLFELEWPVLAAGMFTLVVGLILSFAVPG
jgi:hypothetical protein